MGVFTLEVTLVVANTGRARLIGPFNPPPPPPPPDTLWGEPLFVAVTGREVVGRVSSRLVLKATVEGVWDVPARMGEECAWWWWA